MKSRKFKWGNPLFVAFLAIAGIFGVSATVIDKQVKEEQVVEKAEAAVNSHKYTRLQAVDEIGLTWHSDDYNYADLKIHFYYIHIDPDCIFKTTNEDNATKDELDAMKAGAGLNWTINNDASADFYGSFCDYWDGSTYRRSYLFDFPWYITGFTYQYYNTKNVYTTNSQNIYNWQEYRGDFIYGSYASPSFSTRESTKTSVYVDVPLHTLDFDTNGGTEIDSQVVMEYQKCEEPSDPTKSGYTFWKWTATDSLDASEYTFNASTLTGDTTIYAQFTPLNPTVYFVNGYSWGSPHIHYWGGTCTETTWPGNALSQTEASVYVPVGNTWYNIRIWKYTISGSPAFIRFNDNDDPSHNPKQSTGNLTCTNGGIYYYEVSSSYEPVVSYLISLMNSMGSYTYNGQEYSKSICNLGGSSASLVSGYNSLVNSGTADIVTSITNSTINTYATPVTSPSGTKADITIPVLIAQINKNTFQGVYGAVRNFTPFNLFGEEDNLSTIIIIVASSVALLSVTALSILVIKKRKNKEE